MKAAHAAGYVGGFTSGMGRKEKIMKAFKDKVAVITGGASGIGRGLAERCLQEGMENILQG